LRDVTSLSEIDPAKARVIADHIARGLPLYPPGFHDTSHWSDAERGVFHFIKAQPFVIADVAKRGQRKSIGELR